MCTIPCVPIAIFPRLAADVWLHEATSPICRGRAYPIPLAPHRDRTKRGKRGEKEERRAGKGEGKEQEGGGDGGEARYDERRCMAVLAVAWLARAVAALESSMAAVVLEVGGMWSKRGGVGIVESKAIGSVGPSEGRVVVARCSDNR